jgi:hypothetical protein
MSAVGWPLVEIASQLLEGDERDAVLGDLEEANESSWRGLLGIFDLFLRRQAILWKNSKPWLAGFGIAVPCSYLLMHVSVSVTCTYCRLIYHKVFPGHAPTGHEGYFLLLCHIALLIVWSWTSGFIVGSVSRRTLWTSAALCATACVYSLGTSCIDISRLYFFLFLIPALWGVRHGLRVDRIGLSRSFVLAASVTALMIAAWSSNALWILNWALIWPVWYLVAMAIRAGKEDRVQTGLRIDPAT